MTLEQDWERLESAYWKAREQSAMPEAHIFVSITELRKEDNKGIDFAIRRLYADPEYRNRIRLYGAPTSKYPRYPLRVTHQRLEGYREYHYALISILSDTKWTCEACGAKFNEPKWLEQLDDVENPICPECGSLNIDLTESIRKHKKRRAE